MAVYKDIADVKAYHEMDLTYTDLCTPEWLESDPEIFYGFWGMCFNDYRNTTPHEGYKIVKEWKQKFFQGENANQMVLSELKDVLGRETEEEEISDECKVEELQQKTEERKRSNGPAAFFIYTSNV